MRLIIHMPYGTYLVGVRTRQNGLKQLGNKLAIDLDPCKPHYGLEESSSSAQKKDQGEVSPARC